MGIVNATPDSFSDGGLYQRAAAAISKGKALFAEGADIVDVGGESTRPGANMVDIETELFRVLPVIEELSEYGVVSIDTYKPEVARRAVATGATIINDVSASLWPVAAETGAGWVAMHKQGTPQSMQQSPHYDDVVSHVANYLFAKATQANDAGVTNVWIDPGFGFGKTLEHNLALLANLDVLTKSPWPVAVGISKKTMLGQLLADADQLLEPLATDQRFVGSIATASYALINGAKLVRVHDVQATGEARAVFAEERHNG